MRRQVLQQQLLGRLLGSERMAGGQVLVLSGPDLEPGPGLLEMLPQGSPPCWGLQPWEQLAQLQTNRRLLKPCSKAACNPAPNRLPAGVRSHGAWFSLISQGSMAVDCMVCFSVGSEQGLLTASNTLLQEAYWALGLCADVSSGLLT